MTSKHSILNHGNIILEDDDNFLSASVQHGCVTKAVKPVRFLGPYNIMPEGPAERKYFIIFIVCSSVFI